MKRIVMIVVALLGLGTVSAHQDDAVGNVYSQAGPKPDHLEFRYYGFYGVVNFTYMTNLNQQHDLYTDKYSLMGLTAVAGFQWRKESAVGVGISYLMDGDGAFSQIPLFVELRSYYLRNQVSPYTAIQLGYSIPIASAKTGTDYTLLTKGGVVAGLEIGGRVAISRNFGLNVGVGYQLIQSRSVERGVGGEVATRLPELYHNLKVLVGFTF